MEERERAGRRHEHGRDRVLERGEKEREGGEEGGEGESIGGALRECGAPLFFLCVRRERRVKASHGVHR